MKKMKLKLSVFVLCALSFVVCKVYAGGYQVYGGDKSYINSSSWWRYYYNINEQDEFTYLGTSSDGSTKEFYGKYNYYVVVANDNVNIDYAGPTSFSAQEIHCAGNIDQDDYWGNLDAVDGEYVELGPHNNDASFGSFVVVERVNSSWDTLLVYTDKGGQPDTSVNKEYDYDWSNDFWYGKFMLYDNSYDYYADFGESYIDQSAIYTTILAENSGEEEISFSGSYTDEDGFLVLNSGRVFSYNDTIKHSVGNNSNGELDTLFVLKKMEAPTVDDVVGSYSSYGHWAYPAEWDITSGSMQGTSKFTSSKVSANLKFTSGSTEKIPATPWSLNSDDSIIFIPEASEYFHLAEGGIIFDVDTDMIEDDEESGYDIWVKQSKGKKTADMAGSWVYQELISDINGNRVLNTRGTIGIDLSGNYSLDVTVNDGSSEIEFQDSSKIKMSSNGNFVLTASDGTSYSGTLNVDNDIFVLSVFGNEGMAGLGIGVKAAEYEDPGELSNDELTVSLEFQAAGTPGQILSGETAKTSSKITITSTNDQVYPKDAEVELLVYASNITTDEEFLVYSETVKLGNLKPGAAKSVNAKFELPGTLTTGEYQLTAICQNDAVACEVEDRFTVDYGYTDFELVLSSIKMPTSIIAGEKVKGKVSVMLENTGNVSTSSSTSSELKIVARSGGAADVEVVSYSLNSGNLKPGKSKKANINVEIPSDFPEGPFDLYVTAVTPTVGDGGDSTVEVSLDTGITVTQSYIDLAVEAGAMKSSSVSIAGTRDTKVKVPLLISNLGNVATDKAQLVDIDVYLEVAGDGQAEPILIAELIDMKISNLKPGKPKKVNVNCVVPNSISAGSYNIYVVVDPDGEIEESSKDNNTCTFEDDISVLHK